MIVIVNYGMCNLGSILNMLKRTGAEAVISSDASEIGKADKIILPGVGAFDNGMKNLDDLDLIPVLNKRVLEDKTPVLGICLGMQLLSRRSEEGSMAGLGWIDAETVKFRFDGGNTNLKIPHMGWNMVRLKKESMLFSDMYSDPRFYFVHSYHLSCGDPGDILTTTFHGYDFPSAIEHKNIFGVQFHPEKSHKYGMKLLKNFVELI